MYQDFFRQYLASNLDAMISMQRESEKGIKQWTQVGGVGDMTLIPQPDTRETSSNLKAELDSLKEKLNELEEKLGL